jgi:hypothetical protein
MGKLLGALASALSGQKQGSSKPHVGVFSVVHGKRGSLEKLDTRVVDTKCGPKDGSGGRCCK